jgi:hypothetical protein
MIAAGGYRDVDTNAVSFDLAPTLRLEVVEARADEVSLDPWSQTTRTLARMEEPTGRLLGADLAQIQFMPDGLISGSSPAHVLLWEGENTPRWLARSAERTRYEIQTNYTDYAIR